MTKTITLTGNRSESALLSQLRFSRQNHCDKKGYLKQGLTLTCKKIKNKIWKKKKAEEVQMNKLLPVPQRKNKELSETTPLRDVTEYQ